MTAKQSEFLRFWKLGEILNYIGVLDSFWAPKKASVSGKELLEQSASYLIERLRK